MSKNIYMKLNGIQTMLKAPKNLMNKFGGYKYRNAESILEAVKPLLKEEKCILTTNTELQELNQSRVYLKVTATLIDCESEKSISVTAYAREEESKKGMDSMQLSGATESYAKKYALSNLFLLDDSKDADSDEYSKQTTQTEQKNKYVDKKYPAINKTNVQTKQETTQTAQKITEGMAKCLRDIASANDESVKKMKGLLKQYGYSKLIDISLGDYEKFLVEFEDKKEVS